MVLNEIVFGRVPRQKPPIALRIDGSLTSDGALVANAFNEHFSHAGRPHPNIDREAAIMFSSQRIP